MTMVVGFAPDGRGRAVLHLAAMLARSAGDELVVCSVVPASWFPGEAKVDAEYQSYLDGSAGEALEHARSRLPGDIPATFLTHHARSIAAGLIEVAEDRGADLIVAGSSSAGGAGYVMLGSATSRLLHSSPVPVALAPHGYRCPSTCRVARVTAAYGASDDDLVLAAGSVAARVEASLRIVSFAVRPHPPYTAGVGTEADESLVAEWTAEVKARARAALEEAGHAAELPEKLEVVVAQGETWEEALDEVE
jgi:nucleotide-binding universal stress UspA family protein